MDKIIDLDQDSKKPTTRPNNSQVAKKEYIAPLLKIYGSMESITLAQHNPLKYILPSMMWGYSTD